MKLLRLQSLLFLVALLFITASVQAQSPYALSPDWYFGSGGKLTFPNGSFPISGTPTAASQNVTLGSIETSTSVCFQTGNVAVYSNTRQAFDATATNLSMNIRDFENDNTCATSASGGAVSFPDPADVNNAFYVILANDLTGGTCGSRGVNRYRFVKSGSTMVYNAGPVQMATGTFAGEAITIGSDDKGGYWLVVHTSSTDNTFRVWHFTPGGISSSTDYTVGSAFFAANNALPSSLKINACQNKIAFYAANALVVHNWDRINGIVGSEIRRVIGVSDPGVGLEFSPDGTKLYYGASSKVNVLDISTGISSVVTGSGDTWSMQLGPDAKIYTSPQSSTSVGVISDPNGAPTYSTVALPGGASVFRGLSNIAWLSPSAPSIETISFPCSTSVNFLTTFGNYFGAGIPVNTSSYSWNFGDGSPATVGNAVPSHTFPAPGNYTVSVSLKDNYCGNTYTATKIINYSGSTSPSITLHPVDKAGCPGDVLQYKVTATGTGLTYQWQVDNGTGFVNASNGVAYANVTTATLTVNALMSMNGYKYRCLVSGSGCGPVNSSTANLKVGSYSLAINSMLSNQSVCLGGNATFSCTTNETAGVDFQWKVNTGSGFVDVVNNGTYAGAKTNTLAVTNVTAGMQSYTYKLVVTNGCTTQESNSAGYTVSTLAFDAASTVAVCSGDLGYVYMFAYSPATITAKQWQEDRGAGFVNLTEGGNYVNVTANGLTINEVTAAMNGYKYRLIVTNACNPSGTASPTLTLAVNTTATYSAHPASPSICAGSNTSLSITATGASGYTYQWQVDQGSGFVNVANNGTYAGATTTTLAITGATVAMNNYKYRCQTKTTGCTTAAPSNVGVLSVSSATLSIATPPAALDICAGMTASMTVSVTGTNPSYQWQLDSGGGFADLPADAIHTNVTTATLSFVGVTQAMNNYKYRVVVSNLCVSNVASAHATLSVAAGPGVGIQPVSAAVWNGGNASFSCTGTGTSLLYKWQAKKPTDPDFASINDGAVYTNTTTNTLSVVSTTAVPDGTKYRCIVMSADCGGVGAATNEVTLSVSSVKVCMVTVDASTGKNMVVFEKAADVSLIDSFVVYREGAVTNQYAIIGKVKSNQFSTFIDASADPKQQAYLYKLGVEDLNHNLSPLSAAHKTMHLTINQGVGQTWNLIWNAYDGIAVNTYNIYRGLSAGSLSLINSVSGSITSYTDNNAPVAANIYYQIEIIPASSCNPTARTEAITAVKSNIAETQAVVTGVDQGTATNGCMLYPNPATDYVSISGLSEQSSIAVYDLSGRLVFNKTNHASSFSVEDMAKGMYIVEIKDGNAVSRMSLMVE